MQKLNSIMLSFLMCLGLCCGVTAEEPSQTKVVETETQESDNVDNDSVNDHVETDQPIDIPENNTLEEKKIEVSNVEEKLLNSAVSVKSMVTSQLGQSNTLL